MNKLRKEKTTNMLLNIVNYKLFFYLLSKIVARLVVVLNIKTAKSLFCKLKYILQSSQRRLFSLLFHAN